MILKLYFREENTIDKSRLMSSFFYICEYLNVIPQGFFDFKGDHADGIDALVDQLDKLDEEQIQALTAFIKTIIRNNSKNAHQLQAGGHSLTCTVLQAVDLSCSQPFCAQVQKPYLECVQRNLGPVSSLSHTCNGTAL